MRGQVGGGMVPLLTAVNHLGGFGPPKPKLLEKQFLLGFPGYAGTGTFTVTPLVCWSPTSKQHLVPGPITAEGESLVALQLFAERLLLLPPRSSD